jgi:hypothetical protein
VQSRTIKLASLSEDLSMNIKIMTQAECMRQIPRLGRLAAGLQQRIHVVAVSALAHIRDHRDTTIATRLLDALPRGQRVEALAFWFNHFSSGKLTLKRGDNGWTATLAKAKDCMESDFQVDEASAVSYADLTKEAKAGKPFTVEQLVKKLKAWADEDGTNEDGSPKVEDSARDLASNLLAMIEDARPRLKAVA